LEILSENFLSIFLIFLKNGIFHQNSFEMAIFTILKNLNPLFLAAGSIPSPFDCFLAMRGTKTLHVRMRVHMENALAVAKFLESSPKIEKVAIF
jgi:O-acetylhomoserine/O-acetylserine sulfhydrylase-like pyridoxal-dependent enzyme